ncbi:MAG: WG repeat-containing protein, partial [Acidobacteria bacterium]|nr:WG repeat-containing protein [Acidobacteriota bacterium]
MRWNFKDQKVLIIVVGLVLLLGVFALSSIRDGANGIFPVKAGGKWGFINRGGKMVVQPQFEQ